MVRGIRSKQGVYDEKKDADLHKLDILDSKNQAMDKIFEKGTSKRIWEELYKVIDSSDVLLNILDARNPNGTRSHQLEEYLRKSCPNKHLVYVINKCDLVPQSIVQKWIRILSKTNPTLAFQASVGNPFGKGTLIQLLKQFDTLHRDKKSISVGFIGYPNVGKSSVINTLKRKAVCKVAPIPGETKVWQYIALTKRIYLIDSPGHVQGTNETETDKVLLGIVRPEKIPEPDHFIAAILNKAGKKSIQNVYGLIDWKDDEDFID